MDTIFATSSGRPPAAIAIIRVSGASAMAAGERLAGSLPAPRHAGLRRLRDHDGRTLDQALVLVFPGPATATGEDMVEFHCHGGRAVIAAVEGALQGITGLRPAEPGEFTRRALMAGRIDLIEAEGLADLLAAETEAQRIAALSAAEGRVSRAVTGWAARIATLSARMEAALDFAEEDDVVEDEATMRGVRDAMVQLAGEIEAVLAAPSVERLRDGIRVTLGGPPNSGKSTLFNLLAGREAAIVSPIAGTTRDRIEVAVAHDGLPFVLTDTAGLARSTDDVIEAIGIERAHDAIETADLLLWLGDGAPPRPDALRLHARADVPGRETVPSGRDLAVAANDPRSVERLWSLVAERGRGLVPRPDQIALHDSQRRWCRRAAEAIGRTWHDPIIGAELLRVAHADLTSLLGGNATESMLDALFGQFCIGK